MNSDRPNELNAQRKNTKSQDAHKNYARLPEQLDILERMAQKEFVPRLEAIAQTMLEEAGTITVKRGDTQDYAGVVIVELMFGRKDGPRGSWTAYLVTMELDPQRNEVCLQAGPNLHMNRTIAFGTKDWEVKLIDGFEWLLSDSMRPNLRIRN
ncbi:MAG: hypothetical protein ACM3S0_10780 [Acidobacteriota bacterium]